MNQIYGTEFDPKPDGGRWYAHTSTFNKRLVDAGGAGGGFADASGVLGLDQNVYYYAGPKLAGHYWPPVWRLMPSPGDSDLFAAFLSAVVVRNPVVQPGRVYYSVWPGVYDKHGKLIGGAPDLVLFNNEGPGGPGWVQVPLAAIGVLDQTVVDQVARTLTTAL